MPYKKRDGSYFDAAIAMDRAALQAADRIAELERELAAMTAERDTWRNLARPTAAELEAALAPVRGYDSQSLSPDRIAELGAGTMELLDSGPNDETRRCCETTLALIADHERLNALDICVEKLVDWEQSLRARETEILRREWALLEGRIAEVSEQPREPTPAELEAALAPEVPRRDPWRDERE